MLHNKGTSRDVAVSIMRSKAYEIRPNDPFIYASRIISPDYVDVRLLAGDPEERSRVIGYLSGVASSLKPDIIGSHVTADVPFASMVADRLGLPLFYMRGEEKMHGKGKNIEGMREESIRGRNVLHVGDLLTKGTTSISFAEGTRSVGGLENSSLDINLRLKLLPLIFQF